MNGPHIKLAASEAVISEWIKSFMPAHDLYFIDERLLSRLDHSPGMLLIPREEFSQHPTYRDISVANSGRSIRSRRTSSMRLAGG
ncbi:MULTISPECIES: hypothetical protein [unclassified Exiguobacterium]|uniref:hypothetical protein n=1 Tax=unclassified Exiguobacterium TaxID=2644629 RepID=UPI00103D6533|nr:MULTISPECIES: hypothetical protein [unclassified Exiguobacterium]TCI43306.1 hypothetical protein EVJ31_12565 [Exiguobacterium sp. SH5S32]TCI50028.1 hypothetical protein EVJ25_13070 [Exiguobacterium sp. SH1S4]TCI68428.1 hypothetical protein EVJ23_12555 [Exiguobacterium sp. SH1S1]